MFILANNTNDVQQSTADPRREDIRDSLDPSDPVEIVFPLSDAVQRRLEDGWAIAEPLPDGLSRRMYEAMQTSEVLWAAHFPRQKMVFKLTAEIVVKAVRRVHDYTEYTTLQYLEQHRPSIPAPRPLGLVRMSGISLIFMTLMPSTTLGEMWHQLDGDQKNSIRGQLDNIFNDLRSIPYDRLELGGVAGEGCKDLRRHLRRSEKSITTVKEFEEFLYSSPRPGGQVFVDLLRQVSPSSDSLSSLKIVFTHGDLRADNIVVNKVDGTNQYVVSGLLDWEYSGFYPEYYEAIRCTNCITPYEEDDWFIYLPDRISPKSYAHWWLLDRVREARVL